MACADAAQEAEREIRQWHEAIVEHAEWATNLSAIKKHEGEMNQAIVSIHQYQDGIRERDRHNPTALLTPTLYALHAMGPSSHCGQPSCSLGRYILGQRTDFALKTLRRVVSRWVHVRMMRAVRDWHGTAASCRLPSPFGNSGETAYLSGEISYLRQTLLEKDAVIAELRLRCTTGRLREELPCFAELAALRRDNRLIWETVHLKAEAQRRRDHYPFVASTPQDPHSRAEGLPAAAWPHDLLPDLRLGVPDVSMEAAAPSKKARGASTTATPWRRANSPTLRSLRPTPSPGTPSTTPAGVPPSSSSSSSPPRSLVCSLTLPVASSPPSPSVHVRSPSLPVVPDELEPHSANTFLLEREGGRGRRRRSVPERIADLGVDWGGEQGKQGEQNPRPNLAGDGGLLLEGLGGGVHEYADAGESAADADADAYTGESLFLEWDRNGDNSLSHSELKQSLKKDARFNLVLASEGFHWKEVWSTYDSTGTGLISKAEFIRFYRQVLNPPRSVGAPGVGARCGFAAAALGAGVVTV